MKSLPASRYVKFLSWFMIAFPLVYLPFTSFIFDLSATGIWSIVLSPLFYIASLLWVATGIGVRRTQKWCWYTFAFAQIFSFYFNALNLIHYSQSQYKGFAFILAILIQLYIWLALRQEIRVPYLFPKIRWWESGIASMNHIPVRVASLVADPSVGQILDISPRGAFVKCPHDFTDFQKVKILIDDYSGIQIEIPATVVWIAKSTVTHPRGIGIKFYGLDKLQKRKLKALLVKFKQNEKQIYGRPVLHA